MSKFGERTQLFYGSVADSDGIGGEVGTDGFLTVTLGGSDADWTYATAVINATWNGSSEVLGRITWAYSAQQDFRKDISVTVPLHQGEKYRVDWSDKRKADNIVVRLLWTPMP